jgi:acetylornithine aminotransferase/acetylornithine/N-succinyldiaminopimelate aminotransferase
VKEIVPPNPPIVRNDVASIQQLFQKNVLPTYARFDLVLSHGSGSYVWDVTGKRYLDLGSGIAVCALGHAHPAFTEALIEQSKRLVHVSNLYYHEPQGRLAGELVKLIAPGKVFFSNSGAEANEGLFKLARKFGHDSGRFEIITAENSFHGRTLAGIAATGQDKVKKGFEPMVAGFRHVPYNDLEAVRNALSPATVAVMIEGIQGEGGVTPATREYLLGLRQLCDEKNLLLLWDGVQCGYFRTGRFQSFQRILENTGRASSPSGNGESAQSEDSGFLPDAISMAKSLGGGFPMGAFWVRDKHTDLLGPGSHGTTFGGTPLGCAVALKILETVQREKLEASVRETGAWLRAELVKLTSQHSAVFRSVRGLGFMLGLELVPELPAFKVEGKSAAALFTSMLQHAGMLVIPAGQTVIRLLPPLNLKRSEAEEALETLDHVAHAMGGGVR